MRRYFCVDVILICLDVILTNHSNYQPLKLREKTVRLDVVLICKHCLFVSMFATIHVTENKSSNVNNDEVSVEKAQTVFERLIFDRTSAKLIEDISNLLLITQ